MKTIKIFSISIFVFCLTMGCITHKQQLITGEPEFYSIKPDTGAIYDRDVIPKWENTSSGIIPHKGEIITLVVNNVFIRYLKETFGNPHVLVYAEVYDDGKDDPSTAVSKLIFNQINQPPGVNLGIADRIIYGPTAFKGFPIRIRFFIVELDKEQKKMASNILDAAANIASAAKPEAAPVVGVGLRIAKLLNALNQDDFELRFDLTLYPVDVAAVSKIEDARLNQLIQDKKVFISRVGKQISPVMPLRTGEFLIIKRELAERFPDKEKTGDALSSFLEFDWAQRGFINPYTTTAGNTIYAQEIIVYQGGKLYRVIQKLLDPAKPGEKPEDKEIPSAIVRLQHGPNKYADINIGPGYRQRLKDQTYVILSMLNGLPAGISADELRAGSERDMARIRSLLDNPDETPTLGRLEGQVNDLASSVLAVIQNRRIAEAASKRVGRDPKFRQSPDYPEFWIQQLRSIKDLDEKNQDYRNAVAINSSILETLNDLFINIPLIDPTDKDKIDKLKALQKIEHFAAAKDKIGLFELTNAGIQHLKN
ncbi:MAG: hypothetical protein JSV31_24740 [Desulfobacterales bacterium]|nr:MAG: hypothetical protein JSV31_24740 [Desulfobacterales bacterium]